MRCLRDVQVESLVESWERMQSVLGNELWNEREAWVSQRFCLLQPSPSQRNVSELGGRGWSAPAGKARAEGKGQC